MPAAGIPTFFTKMSKEKRTQIERQALKVIGMHYEMDILRLQLYFSFDPYKETRSPAHHQALEINYIYIPCLQSTWDLNVEGISLQNLCLEKVGSNPTVTKNIFVPAKPPNSP
jgi:hypothetical protein